MANLPTTDTLAAIVPVALGGILAIAGGYASQIAIHRLTEKREIAKLRRDRLESIMRCVLAHQRWIAERSTKMMFRNEDHDTPSPLDEAKMLQSLYFPQLAEPLVAVEGASLPLVRFIFEQRIRHMHDASAFANDFDPTPFDEPYNAYLDAVSGLAKACRALLSDA